jgi:putative transposase
MVIFYRRNLPHWHPQEQDIFLTWRLKGSLPSHLRQVTSNAEPGKRFLDLDRALDRADVGPVWLRDPRIAQGVVDVLKRVHDEGHAVIHTYAIMANHIHVLIAPRVPVRQITRLVKGATARQANLCLGFSGSHFWQDESFDHWIRNPGEWQKICTYIEENPEAAGLVSRKEEWPWSSASHPINKR